MHADRIRWLLKNDPDGLAFALEMHREARSIMETLDELIVTPPATPSLKWHDILKEAAPKDRPVFLLSIQSQENGGFYITGDVAKWDKNSQCFIHGLSFYSGIGNMIATHWCELSDMDLPINPDTKY